MAKKAPDKEPTARIPLAVGRFAGVQFVALMYDEVSTATSTAKAYEERAPLSPFQGFNGASRK